MLNLGHMVKTMTNPEVGGGRQHLSNIQRSYEVEKEFFKETKNIVYTILKYDSQLKHCLT